MRDDFRLLGSLAGTALLSASCVASPPPQATAPAVPPAGTPAVAQPQANATTQEPASEPSSRSNAPDDPAYPFPMGTYVQPHVAFENCDQPDPCEVEVKDVLTLRAAADGALGVSIEVTQDHGHSCYFEGVLAEIAPELWGWDDEAQHCRIELKYENESFALTSDGCREDYCGARAHLVGTFAAGGFTEVAP